MSEKIIIGEVLKPVGIRGEVKVKLYADSPDVFLALKEAEVGGVKYQIMQSRWCGGAAAVYFKGVADRNAADLLRGQTITTERANLPPPEQGRFYIADLIGCRVTLQNGVEKGKITDILSSGAADIIVLEAGEQTLMFPHLKEVVLKVDIAAKTVTVDEKRFNEVVVEN